MQESDKNVYDCKGNYIPCTENNACDVEAGCEIDNQVRRRFHNPSLEMQDEDKNAFNKTTSSAESPQAIGNKEYSMHELQVLEGSSDNSSVGIKDGATQNTPSILNILAKTPLDTENQALQDNHTNTAFIHEEIR